MQVRFDKQFGPHTYIIDKRFGMVINYIFCIRAVEQGTSEWGKRKRLMQFRTSGVYLDSDEFPEAR